MIENQQQIQGLPIKYTNAPKFVSLQDQYSKNPKFQREEERVDEFADLYKAMGIHELTGKELIYIKRFEQMGFWRKKFVETE